MRLPTLRTSAVAVIAAALSAAAPALAQQAPAGEYVIDRTHASLTWKILHQGLSFYTARFTSFDIQLSFNPADVSKSKVRASIDPKSVETDYLKTRPATNQTDFNAELVSGANFFNAGKFPTITFVSKTITKTSDKTGKMTGDLTFLGVTKPVTLDVTMNGSRSDPRTQKQKVGFSAAGVIKRSDFGLPGTGSVADEARIEIEAELVQK